MLGRGCGGLVVSVLAFYSDHLVWIPQFFYNICDWKEKEIGVGSFTNTTHDEHQIIEYYHYFDYLFRLFL